MTRWEVFTCKNNNIIKKKIKKNFRLCTGVSWDDVQILRCDVKFFSKEKRMLAHVVFAARMWGKGSEIYFKFLIEFQNK